MRRVGLIGGLSWESTRLYYDAINRAVAARLGGVHSAPLIIDSLDFARSRRRRAKAAGTMRGAAIVEARAAAASRRGRSGRDRQQHDAQVRRRVRAAVPLPLIHIVDPLREALARDGRLARCCSRRASRWSRTTFARRSAEAGDRGEHSRRGDRAMITGSSTRS
jgi:aspartate racemase